MAFSGPERVMGFARFRGRRNRCWRGWLSPVMIAVEHFIEPLVVAVGQLGADQGSEEFVAEPVTGVEAAVVAVVVQVRRNPLANGALCVGCRGGEPGLQAHQQDDWFSRLTVVRLRPSLT